MSSKDQTQARTHGHQVKLIIEGATYDWNEQYITGAQIKQLADLPPEAEIFLSAKHPWKDEQISDIESVNLARPEIEHFYQKKDLKVIIDGNHYQWSKQYISGREIKALATLPEDCLVFLSIAGPGEDEAVGDDANVDLATPGIERFYSKQLQVNIAIIVNGREKMWNKRTLSFQEVVVLAFNTYNDAARTCYTVTYKGGPKENPKGTMVFGDTVFIQTKMIFNVTATDKS